MTFLKYIGKNVYKMKKFTGGKRTFGSLYLLKQTMLNDKKYDYYHLVTGSDFFLFLQTGLMRYWEGLAIVISRYLKQ